MSQLIPLSTHWRLGGKYTPPFIITGGIFENITHFFFSSEWKINKDRLFLSLVPNYTSEFGV